MGWNHQLVNLWPTSHHWPPSTFSCQVKRAEQRVRSGTPLGRRQRSLSAGRRKESPFDKMTLEEMEFDFRGYGWWVQKSQTTTLACIKPVVNNGINYQIQRVSWEFFHQQYGYDGRGMVFGSGGCRCCLEDSFGELNNGGLNSLGLNCLGAR